MRLYVYSFFIILKTTVMHAKAILLNYGTVEPVLKTTCNRRRPVLSAHLLQIPLVIFFCEFYPGLGDHL